MDIQVVQSKTDPTVADLDCADKVPDWVMGYLRALVNRQFPRQQMDPAAITQVKKFVDGVVDNLVGMGLVYRLGASQEWISA